MRTGTVSLPLHPGKCPAWLFQRMKPLTKEISRLIIDSYGTTELLKRISDPMFFQALSCVIGFDWHSSGTTTTTCGALKEAITSDMGIVVCGGKGKTSRKTPSEIDASAGKFNLDGARLKKASYLSAKVDSSCIQAGYELYHHCFFFDENGNWAVVQQGMNDANGYARRYHWFDAETFVDDPPDKIAGIAEPSALNLVSDVSEDARKVSLDLVNDNPIHLRRYFTGQTTLSDDHTSMPERHEILPCDLSGKDWQLLQNAYELQPQNYEELVCLKGMGGKKLRALALVARLIHGTELDWKDPVKYSFAHGGKDGIPYPVDRSNYDHSISFLRDILAEAKGSEKEKALRRLASVS
ncbi:MAG: DUF763 domain-containing protein [Candidatus ainarchaeum sp.]|nr:DUF763 domain-containing protein [Candidatus ainarchaeum sp.]